MRKSSLQGTRVPLFLSTDNGVGNAGAKALAEALKVNRGLQVLYLGGALTHTTV